MKTIRRLYVYGIAAVALVLAVVGAINLLELLINQVWIVFGGRSWIEGGDDWSRRQLSLFLPFVVIATPIWMLHWWLAERARHAPNHEPERQSTIRALFLTAALALSALIVISELNTLLPALFKAGFGTELPAWERNTIPQSMAIIAVLSGTWIFHWRARESDAAEGPLASPSIWIARIYIYGLAAAGIIMMAVGASNLLEVAGDSIAGRGENFGFGVWWHEPVATDLALVLAGFLAWVIHWGHSLRTIARTDWRGSSERSSFLRPFYLTATLVIFVFLTLLAVQTGLRNALRQLLDVPSESGTLAQTLDIFGPFIVAVPLVLALIYQRFHLFSEARSFNDSWQPITASHLFGYGLSMLGLGFAAIGAVDLLSMLFELMADGSDLVARPDDWWRGQLATAAGGLVAGLAVWLWFWLNVRHRATVDPERERSSTIRQAYLFIAFGVSAVAVIVSAAIVAYQVLERLLGVAETGNLVMNLSVPFSILVVALGIAVYHGIVLRQEVTLGDLLERTPDEDRPARLELLLVGPPGSDLNAVANELSEHVPRGFELSARDRFGKS